jgi:hypothetical protein
MGTGDAKELSDSYKAISDVACGMFCYRALLEGEYEWSGLKFSSTHRAVGHGRC